MKGPKNLKVTDYSKSRVDGKHFYFADLTCYSFLSQFHFVYSFCCLPCRTSFESSLLHLFYRNKPIRSRS